MRSRIPLLALVFALGSLALPLAAHAGIPFFGPIIPPDNNVCPLGWGALITVINNIISFLLTLAIVFVAPIMIAYAGFLYVVNAVNPSGISKAKGILLNTVVGIVIAFAGWMIVDALMAVLYNPATVGTTWSNLIVGDNNNLCVIQAGSLPGAQLNQTAGPGITTGPGTGGTLSQCSSSNPACSTQALQSAGLTAKQADVMSCIAVTESSGNPSTPPYNTTHPGSNSTACGTFQITQTTWNTTASGACSDFSTNCQNAACNLQVAETLVNQSGYTSWTCPGCNSKAAGCVQQYGP